jgi:hypothetical protein
MAEGGSGVSLFLAGGDLLREPEYCFLAVSQNNNLIVTGLELEIPSPRTNGHMRDKPVIIVVAII